MKIHCDTIFNSKCYLETMGEINISRSQNCVPYCFNSRHAIWSLTYTWKINLWMFSFTWITLYLVPYSSILKGISVPYIRIIKMTTKPSGSRCFGFSGLNSQLVENSYIVMHVALSRSLVSCNIIILSH